MIGNNNLNFIPEANRSPHPAKKPKIASHSRSVRQIHPHEMDHSARVIQKCAREFLERKSKQYDVLCGNVLENGSAFPRASEGATKVYLPDKMPKIVLKLAGEEAQNRLGQMKHIRQFLNSHDCTHLAIPEASIKGEFLIERRLPINTGLYHNIELYLTYPESFNDAIREMTRLYSEHYIGDILVPQFSPFALLSGEEGYDIRFDNMPLFIEEGKGGNLVGKIGLIDLERLEDHPRVNGLEELARMFPLHLDVIQDEANKLNLRFDNDALINASEMGRRYLNAGFSEFNEWLKHKEDAHALSPVFEISNENKAELVSSIKDELLRLNAGRSSPDFLSINERNPEEIAEEFAPIIAQMLMQNIQNEIERNEAEIKELTTGLSISEINRSELIDLRSISVKRLDLIKNLDRLPIFEKMSDNRAREEAASILLSQTMKILTQEDLIHSFYSAPHLSKCWIRY